MKFMSFNQKALILAIALTFGSGLAVADDQMVATSNQSSVPAVVNHGASGADVSAASAIIVPVQPAQVAPASFVSPGVALPPNVQIEPPRPAKKIRKKMPGVGSFVISDKNTLSQSVLSVGNEGTRVVALSNIFPNRISTPFVSPRVIDSSNTDIRQDNSSIFISPKGTEPFVIYVTGSDPGDQVISLTIVPKRMAAQTVVLQADAQAAVRQQKNESYTQNIVDILRRIASGSVPEGFSKADIAASVAVSGNVRILPRERYSSSWVDVYRYTVCNDGNDTIELSETSFYKKGVRAVSIYPNLTLGKSETTDVFVVADKTAIDGGIDGGH